LKNKSQKGHSDKIVQLKIEMDEKQAQIDGLVNKINIKVQEENKINEDKKKI